MRVAAGMLVAVSACYSPTVPAGAPCDLALNNCPAGQRCEMTASGAFCGAVPTLVDGPTSNGDGPDGPRPDTAPGCFGTGLIHDVCLMPPPTNDVMITADRTINTAMVGNGHCDSIIAQSGGGPSLCMVSGRSITIANGAKLIGQGTNPLLLVASQTITINGAIDVASRIGATTGAGSDTTCASPNGNNATVTDGAGGGGAGGSFGTKGGNGGTGRTPGSPTPGGQASNPVAPTALRGGCSGGRGGYANGSPQQGAGTGGAGGGAVYLIAGTSITISSSGIINASGSGGGAGTAGAQASSGAGAGGSGGMIGIDTPSVSSSGQVFANGGSGGGGGGDQFNNPGSPGVTPSTATTAAQGGSGGTGGGGRGGDGSVTTGQGNTGANGPNPYTSGGGGGGGGGVIKVYGAPPSSLGGMVSPPAT